MSCSSRYIIGGEISERSNQLAGGQSVPIYRSNLPPDIFPITSSSSGAWIYDQHNSSSPLPPLNRMWIPAWMGQGDAPPVGPINWANLGVRRETPASFSTADVFILGQDRHRTRTKTSALILSLHVTALHFQW